MYLQPIKADNPIKTIVFVIGDIKGPRGNKPVYRSKLLAELIGPYETAVPSPNTLYACTAERLYRVNSYSYVADNLTDVDFYLNRDRSQSRLEFLRVMAIELEEAGLLPISTPRFRHHVSFWIRQLQRGRTFDMFPLIDYSWKLNKHLSTFFPSYGEHDSDTLPVVVDTMLSILCAIKAVSSSGFGSVEAGHFVFDAFTSFVIAVNRAIKDGRVKPLSIEQLLTKMLERAVWLSN